MKEWKAALAEDSSVNLVVPASGSKRKAVGVLPILFNQSIDLRLALKDVTVNEAEIRSKYDSGTLEKVRLFLSYGPSYV